MNKDVFKNITYGLYIVSSKAGDTLAGCIVNTVTQVTSKEPLIAVSINKDNYTNKVIKESKRVAISILSQNTKMELIKTFGFTSSIDTNKFANVNYEIKDNLPIVKENVCGYITGSVINIIPLSTHDIFLIKVDSSEKLSDDEVLTYQYYQKNMKGISPKKAPSYIEENHVNTSQNIYRCSICGYIYDDSKEKVKFADLPDDWVCPMCGVGKDKFEKIN